MSPRIQMLNSEGSGFLHPKQWDSVMSLPTGLASRLLPIFCDKFAFIPRDLRDEAVQCGQVAKQSGCSSPYFTSMHITKCKRLQMQADANIGKRLQSYSRMLLVRCPSNASYITKGSSPPFSRASTSARTTLAGTSPIRAVWTRCWESMNATWGRPSTLNFCAHKSFSKLRGSVEPVRQVHLAFFCWSTNVYFRFTSNKGWHHSHVWHQLIYRVILLVSLAPSILVQHRIHPRLRTQRPCPVAAGAQGEQVPFVGNRGTSLLRSPRQLVFLT